MLDKKSAQECQNHERELRDLSERWIKDWAAQGLDATSAIARLMTVVTTFVGTSVALGVATLTPDFGKREEIVPKMIDRIAVGAKDWASHQLEEINSADEENDPFESPLKSGLHKEPS